MYEKQRAAEMKAEKRSELRSERATKALEQVAQAMTKIATQQERATGLVAQALQAALVKLGGTR